MTPTCGSLLEPKGSGLEMLKISYAGCLSLSPAISLQFSVEMCIASKNCEKFTKNPFLGVQGHQC